MNELSTRYLGLELANPIVASASPLSKDVGSIRKLEDAGVSAVVIHSLFEEQIDFESQQLHHYLSSGESYAEAQSYFPDLQEYKLGPDAYLELISKAKKAIDIPLIASLNGITGGGWTRYAHKMQEAGADAIELNIYYLPTDPTLTGAEVEHLYLDVLREVRRTVDIPLAVKLSPYFSATANMARKLAENGADGLVLFNRFYQPDLHVTKLEVVPNLQLSDSGDLRLPLRWVAILYSRISVDLAITSGVHTYEDVLKGMMAGANVTMMASELLQNGLGRVKEILHELTRWMQEYEYSSITEMRGSLSQRNVAEPAAFERANYMKILDSIWPDPALSLA